MILVRYAFFFSFDVNLAKARNQKINRERNMRRDTSVRVTNMMSHSEISPSHCELDGRTDGRTDVLTNIHGGQ